MLPYTFPYNHTGYAQVLEQWSPSGSNPDVTYTIGDDVVTQYDPTNGARHLLYDGHGSTRQLVDNNEDVTDAFSYDGYGVMLGANPANAATSLLYTGEMYDSSASMYYLRARWYDQQTGKFNRMDPFAGNTQDPQSLHKYLYCHANPVNGTDPTGKRFHYVQVAVAVAITFTILAIAATAYTAYKDPQRTFWGVVKDVEAGIFGGIVINVKINGEHKWMWPSTILKEYKCDIENSAIAHGIPADLLAGVLYTEMKHYALFSDFGADYLGHGSIGPAQLKVKNVRKWVPELSSTSESEIADMLLDPATAIDILAKCMDNFNAMAMEKENENIIQGFAGTRNISERAVWSGKMNSAKDNWGSYSHNWYMTTLGPKAYRSALDILWNGSLPPD